MKMKKSVGKVLLLSAATCVCADMDVSALVTVPMGDRPDANHAWAVHDRHRPEPVKVEVPDSGVPSDAMMLFDGTLDSIARNWCDENGNPTKWTVEAVVAGKRGNARGAKGLCVKKGTMQIKWREE